MNVIKQGIAAVVRSAGAPFEIEPVTITLSHPQDVLVRVVAVGICHTDLIMRDQLFPFPLPGVLGHEGAGIVEAVGEEVTVVAPGDHVVLSFMSCGSCHTCSRGEPAYCENFFALNIATARADGTNGTCDHDGHALHDHFFGQSSFGQYALAHSRNVVKVDPDIPLDLLGPLGCGIQTGAGAVLNSLAVEAGASVAVFGAGSVGLSAIMAAATAGANPIIAIDPVEGRRNIALELGATHAVDPMAENAVEAIQAITQRGCDYTVETSGSTAVLRQAIDCLAVRGACGVVGAPALGAEASFDVNALLIPGRKIVGICEGDSVPSVFIPQLIELYRKGRFPFDRLIRFYDLTQINEAIDDTLKGITIKAVLRIPEGEAA